MRQHTLFDETPSEGGRAESRRARLLRRIRRLADEVLPARAHGGQDGRSTPKSQGYPVTEDHCFRRIAYDAALGRRWDDAVPRPFEAHASTPQLRRALKSLEAMDGDPKRARTLNRQSLQHRDRL